MSKSNLIMHAIISNLSCYGMKSYQQFLVGWRITVYEYMTTRTVGKPIRLALESRHRLRPRFVISVWYIARNPEGSCAVEHRP